MSIHLSKAPQGTYRQQIRIDQHTLLSDVAPAFGGEGSAPDPHDLFDASLAACKAITVMMVARRRKLALDSIDLVVSRDASAESKGHYALDVAMAFNGDLDETARSKLLEIADKCPIHKLMTQAQISIDTHLG